MNIIALVHVIAGVMISAVSVPLIRRKVRMNSWYGFRISEAFQSEKLWYDINAYGGRMYLYWGIAVIIAGACGLMLPQRLWLVYALASIAVVLGGLAIAVGKTQRYAARLSRNKALGR